MWHRLTLRSRIYTLLVALMGIAFCGGSIIVWHTAQIQRLTTRIIEANIAAFETAEALEIALINQKGFVTYYLLDRDPNWLRRFGEYGQIFTERLKRAQELAQTSLQQQTIARIAGEYDTYVTLKNRVIQLYKANETAAGAELHKTVRQHFFDIKTLCGEYKQMHASQIQRARETSRRESARLRAAVVSTVAVQTLLVIGLGVLFLRQILEPVRHLIDATAVGTPAARPKNLLTALSHNVEDMMAHADQTRNALERSRESLLQSEKMATVGRLAAGMAHSIRNPFTSVKMRLFSLNRSLDLNSEQLEDFEVITQEIRHIDTIVQNFLEFSRPPKLCMQQVSPSVIVDNAVQLLKYRLRSYAVRVELVRQERLPEVAADPEQLKEVLVNLIINACEAIRNGGHILIEETVDKSGRRPMAKIRLADNGPGIPPALVEKIFQPFFTTKEEGTGLGLSIATNILIEHGGALKLEERPSGGAAFVIELPIGVPR